MRRAAPVALWGLYLGLLGGGLWVWSGWHLAPALLLGAAAAILVLAAGQALRGGGEPPALAMPEVSVPVVPAALGVAAAVVGAEVGLWLILIGAGLFALGAGALAREALAQRRAAAIARDMAARAARPLLVLAALAVGAAGLSALSAPRSRAQPGGGDLVQRGRVLFQDGCSTCHGLDGSGIQGRGPSLRGAGARAADFYIRTGRMPLDDPADEPVRKTPAYGGRDRAALVAFVASLGGPPIPRVDPAVGSLSEGRQLFAEHCAGCHQIQGKGGIVTGALVPSLEEASPRDIAEAVRIGPYLMPRFDARQITPAQMDSLARYVRSTRRPDDRGGWGLGNLGPIPEGMVAWLIAAAALLVAARLIGERTGS